MFSSTDLLVIIVLTYLLPWKLTVLSKSYLFYTVILIVLENYLKPLNLLKHKHRQSQLYINSWNADEWVVTMRILCSWIIQRTECACDTWENIVTCESFFFEILKLWQTYEKKSLLGSFTFVFQHNTKIRRFWCVSFSENDLLLKFKILMLLYFS